MISALHRISRLALPPDDRRWLDALFAEADAVESAPARLLWLFGAAGLLLNRNLAALCSPVSLLLLLATGFFATLAVIEYEGLALEDDWYGPIATLLATTLVGVWAVNLRRRHRGSQP
ncbi:MAG TPA: hypothetical protein VG845_08760 [Dehalococcoidia bacterium]|nr:hypothetical protein [Dehalococcoidia bacterium]